MLTRRDLVAALPLAAMASWADAAEKTSYIPEGFAAAQAAGGPILVEIFAPWCPTCRAQQPILERLEAEPEFAAFKVFRVDFDKQKDVVRSFGAKSQSTLIVFKGGQETGRSVGDTDAASIAKLLSSAL
jgi:thioredoxin 1